MICNEIFNSALKLLNECGLEENTDFADRAPYIISAMCCENEHSDDIYRSQKALGERRPFSPCCIELTEDFPLCDKFITPCTFYLASMLIIDENETLSDNFYEKYIFSIENIRKELPFTIGKTANAY